MNQNFDVDKISRKIRKFTRENDHTQSLLFLAKEMDDKETISGLKIIGELSTVCSGLSMESTHKRHGIYEQLLQKVKPVYGEEVYKKIHNSL